MIKIARLPNSIFAVANLAFSFRSQAERLPPHASGEAAQRPAALSKPVGRESTGVEAMT